MFVVESGIVSVIVRVLFALDLPLSFGFALAVVIVETVLAVLAVVIVVLLQMPPCPTVRVTVLRFNGRSSSESLNVRST